ncbi:MAG: membrane-associated protein [Candidatus Rokuibacteriota bacterium]|nr:MAG: membrane-associated protein [Candidatus Rokubacteria bacterium]
MEPQIPLWVKLGYTLFVAVLVPIYLRHYGPANFLWFSDVALLATVPGLWAESSLILSAMTVAVGLPEILWNVDFFARLLTGRAPLGLAAYMFDQRLPRYLRGLSLFHVALPVLLVWSVARLGYDPHALLAQIIAGTLLMILSYTLTSPSENINWVFGPGSKPQRRLRPLVYVTMVIVSFPVLVYLPTHLVLARLFPIAR